jgi:hypothetical protein
MASLGTVIDSECSKMLLTGKRPLTRVYGLPPTWHMALIIFSEDKEDSSPQLGKRETRLMDEQIPSSSRPKMTKQDNKSWLVRATENVTVAHRCRQIVSGRLESEQQNLPPLVCVKPAHIPAQGTLFARGISPVESRANETSRAKSEDDHRTTVPTLWSPSSAE